MTNTVHGFGTTVLSLSFLIFYGTTVHRQDVPKPGPDYSKESFVVQRISNTLQFENDGTFRVDTMLQVRVQSASGIQTWGVVQLPYASNESDAAISDVTVTKPHGTVISTPLDNVQDTPAPITVPCTAT